MFGENVRPCGIMMMMILNGFPFATKPILLITTVMMTDMMMMMIDNDDGAG